MEVEALKDNSTEMDRKFRRIASEIVTPLRTASDKGQMVIPVLVGEMQERIAKALAQVHYGFHPDLE